MLNKWYLKFSLFRMFVLRIRSYHKRREVGGKRTQPSPPPLEKQVGVRTPTLLPNSEHLALFLDSASSFGHFIEKTPLFCATYIFFFISVLGEGFIKYMEVMKGYLLSSLLARTEVEVS